MEITKVFKAYVKTVSVKRKDLSNPSKILPKQKQKFETFHTKAIEVANNITKLRDFLFKYQSDYLSEFSPLPSLSNKLSESERDQIDADAQVFMKSCTNAITTLSNTITKKGDSQSKLHNLAVVELLHFYLNNVCTLYSQQRAFRVKQTIERKRLSRLSAYNVTPKKDESKETSPSKSKTNEDKLLEAPSRKKCTPKHLISEKAEDPIETTSLEESKDNNDGDDDDIVITKEEAQIFEEENERLYLELNSLSTEVQNIEGKVIEIGQLQEIFQEKVLAQSEQIENIHHTAVATTENVKEGNEQVRNAIKNSATFRVWILFFLVMCTFSLLFLDWYQT